MIEQNKIAVLVKKLAQKKLESFGNLTKEKQKICSELRMSSPRNSDILKIYWKLKKNGEIKTNKLLEQEFKKRPVRTLSGVTVVAVLTKPWPCPGRCLYCPFEKGVPKSYLSGEPAVERAKFLNYDPYQQVKKRLEVLENNGHPTDKIELIVIGGTWSYLPKKYQTWFIKQCFRGANAAEEKRENTKTQALRSHQNKSTLEKEQKINEKAKHRIIGLTLETRPDYITPREIIRMRKLGCTRMEIGVQIADDEILKKNKRGHFIKEIVKATKLLKDAGFKICYHLMPGLYGSSPKKDFEAFKKIFSENGFRPDMIKIYPCVVAKGSRLYEIFKQKRYKPYKEKQLITLLTKFKSIIPPYIRVNRLIRDIPAWQIQGGNKTSNLREIIQEKMNKLGKICQCIRCREIKKEEIKIKSLKLVKREYASSGGKEIFLSFEDIGENKIAAFLRLRLTDKNVEKIFPILKNAALIRELHTYGQSIPISKTSKSAAQHFGLGKRLMYQAEKIARKNGYKKIAVIAGIGVRQYYRHLGYRLKNTYMVKVLKH